MRAVQFTKYGPPSVVHVDDIPEPHAGPGEIRIAVRASGFSPGETIVRSGRLRGVIATPLPYRTGFDAAGVVDEIGAGVTGAAIGDAVFGMTAMSRRGANADFSVLVAWVPKPAAWSWAEAGGATGPLETSARVLDRLDLAPGRTLLINGAAGGTGAVAVQVARARGLRVIGTASEANHDFLRSLGAEPTTYGEGLRDRVKHADGVFDCFGGALPDLIAIAGDPAKVVTIADFAAAEHGVHMSSGFSDPLAVHGLRHTDLRIPVAATFALEEAAAAHELSETRHGRGRIVYLH
ncbi:NADP-dependent oxidoreductase [Dactylosporangium matsuzakiense]|uniref:NADP-dependent oxidoreductase n=1 Tax=Dactylosporangium matsuzakiense TaxID=53360 RepID=UPI0021C467E5|nr:NADP-dependent oxidoreductase [Dactylosporangium matsuzakiense]UWZ41040.1 NADP-dependent oxidoreductase [Dactylosporangium matsuzakiense]